MMEIVNVIYTPGVSISSFIFFSKDRSTTKMSHYVIRPRNCLKPRLLGISTGQLNFTTLNDKFHIHFFVTHLRNVSFKSFNYKRQIFLVNNEFFCSCNVSCLIWLCRETYCGKSYLTTLWSSLRSISSCSFSHHVQLHVPHRTSDFKIFLACIKISHYRTYFIFGLRFSHTLFSNTLKQI